MSCAKVNDGAAEVLVGTAEYEMRHCTIVISTNDCSEANVFAWCRISTGISVACGAAESADSTMMTQVFSCSVPDMGSAKKHSWSCALFPPQIGEVTSASKVSEIVFELLGDE